MYLSKGRTDGPGTTGRSTFTKQESLSPPIPPHHRSHLSCLPSSLMSLLRAHLPGAKSSAGCRGKQTSTMGVVSLSTSSVCLRRSHSPPFPLSPKLANPGSRPHRKAVKSPVSRPGTASATQVLTSGTLSSCPRFCFLVPFLSFRTSTGF